MLETKPLDYTVPIIFLIDGPLGTFIAFFAFSLGFDPNPAWGNSRIVLLLIGFVLIGASVVLFIQSLS